VSKTLACLPLPPSLPPSLPEHHRLVPAATNAARQRVPLQLHPLPCQRMKENPVRVGGEEDGGREGGREGGASATRKVVLLLL